MSEELKPCPFCGHDTPEFVRLGNAGQSCIVECGYCGCRHESSDEGAMSGSSWNTRAQQPAASEPSSGERAELPPLPEGRAVVRGPVSAFSDPESGTLVDFDCEGPLSYDPDDGEELFTADQMRDYARAALLSSDARTAPQAEPVAWALSHSGGLEFSSKFPMCGSKAQAEQMARQHMGQVTVTALYTAQPAPQAVPQAEAVRVLPADRS